MQQIDCRTAIFDALAYQHDGPLGRKQHVDRLGHAVGISAAAARNIGVPLFRFRRFLGGRFFKDVEGNIEHDRSRPSRHHRLPRLPDRQRHHVAARGLKHALAIGPHRRGKVRLIMAVQFLKRAAIELARRHVSGHCQEWNGIEIGVGERNRQIGGTRTAGGEGRGRFAAHTVVDVRHESGDALVVDGHRLDVVSALVERVDKADISVAAQAEDVRHLFAHEIIDDHLTAVEHVLGHRLDLRCYSGLILASLMIGHHFSISDLWKAPNASGVCCSRAGMSSPCSPSRLMTAGSFSVSTAAFFAALSTASSLRLAVCA